MSKVNLIVNGFYGDVLQKVLFNICGQVPIGYIKYVYYHHPLTGLPVDRAEYVKYHTFLFFEKFLGDPNGLIPLDEELITKMSDCQRIVLKMMDRLEVHRHYSYQQRIDLYYTYLRYWNDVIERNQVNLFLSANVPHEIFDYVIYGLCQVKNIPIRFLYHQGQIEDMALIMNDWKENCLPLQQRFHELLREWADKPESDIVLPEKIQKHYNAQVGNHEDAVPFYMKSVYTKQTWRSRFKFIIEPVEFVYDLFMEAPGKFTRNLFNPVKWGHVVQFSWHRLNPIERLSKAAANRYHSSYYNQHSVQPDLQKKFIYLPLQYQPELSTSPLADAYVDQQLIVQMIAKYLPDNVYLYVKEHPKQTAFCRTIDFYQTLQNTRNVVLVRRDSDSFGLINHSLAVATSTGTPGWEALFRGKPVLMFGSYIYQFADGVFKIHTVAECQQAMEQIVQGAVTPTLKNMKLYLKALGDVSFPAVIDPDYLRVTQLSERDNIANITQAIVGAIQQAHPQAM